MQFVQYPPGQISPADASSMLDLCSVHIRDLCKKGIIKADRLYCPGFRPLWGIYEVQLINFIEGNIPREYANIQVVQKRIQTQMKSQKLLKEKYI